MRRQQIAEMKELLGCAENLLEKAIGQADIEHVKGRAKRAIGYVNQVRLLLEKCGKGDAHA